MADGGKTFEEIGRELGITKNGALWIYAQALKKLRRQPGALKALEMVVELQNAIERKEIVD